REALVLVGVPGAGRNGSAWRSLASGLRDPALTGCIGRRLSAPDLLAGPLPGGRDAASSVGGNGARPDAPGGAVGDRRRLPIIARAQTVALATTPLALFDRCPRRFQLRMLLGLEEPVASSQLDLFDVGSDAEQESTEDNADPRALGRAAHRVLQRWPPL